MNELSREKDEAGRGFRETEFPIFMNGDIFHDLFTVFYIETPPTEAFV